MPEWLKGADCKSAGLPTLVQIQLGLYSKKLIINLSSVEKSISLVFFVYPTKQNQDHLSLDVLLWLLVKMDYFHISLKLLL